MFKRAGATKGGCLAGIVAVFLFVFIPWMPSCGNSNDYAIEALRSCPEAVALLGEPVRMSRVGMACGSSTMQGGLERASWSVPVAGSRARGRYRYSYDAVGGSVRFSGAVEVEGETIDMAGCQ